MNVLVVLAHPNKLSFNHAIARQCEKALSANGHQVITHDLYEEKFDPILPYGEFERDAVLPEGIKRHCEEISRADGIIIVHPNWWGQPPAILKGWIDRVIRPGVAYEFVEGDDGEGIPRGLLRAGSVIIFNTSNTETAREQNVFGDPLQSTWKNCVFDLCGVKNVHRRMFNIVVTSTEEQRRGWLLEVEDTAYKCFPNVTQQTV